MDRPAHPHALKEFPATPLGVQSGIERFPRRNRATNPPPRIESWRCNLTALSHIHNLYFVASRYEVLVYEPNFPDQKLSAQPSLILSPTVHTDTVPDFTDLAPLGSGRTINHLLVDFLGNDEILLLALHDGRVIGYHVNQIQRAIDRRQEPNCVETIKGDDVRPFFSEDVGSSDDPEGRWVLTSDIDGFSRIMDLARCFRREYPAVDMHAHRFCAMAEVSGQKQCGCEFLEQGMRYYLHATWGVMWLDRRAFKRTESVSEALGSEGVPLKVERISPTLNCYDNSNSRQRVRNSSTIYGSAIGRLEDESDESSDDDVDLTEPPMEGDFDGIQLKRVPRNPQGQTTTQIKIPASPIMRLSVKDIFLIQPRSTKSPERPPIGFFDPFFQHIKRNPFMDRVCMHDRINLFAQIVELGIVVVGSAKGRVAIMSLTQTDETDPKSRRPLYGCRMDCILPFRDQEERGDRPLAPLAGIAAGPVQGMLGRQADYSRRWRLLMMYVDNSVLSYELGKSREGRVTVHEFGGLVV
ncbi:Ribonucleotide reductase transcriptional regulator CRT10 [Lasiodiplodia theobromae]|uniref:Uncharacterized protein n=1 Tax=Lasiodiplodia theobromae TaxID=45133 RepID=A0A5N5D6E5_9PEZI|nr:Ribonucleotide reductase transcriptional regulator CRT10 [Lasiodiplodia theobromae]KAB2573135.1 hypothetical protein DBV05_g8211 [Lasiodiplodia theobromae]KAF4544606.1 Ribonucleotide reductase transcriptional regulator CRT10 [Lasiodiplodia theobromae]